MNPRDDHDYSYGPQGGAVLWAAALLTIAGLIGGAVAGLIAIAQWLFS